MLLSELDAVHRLARHLTRGDWSLADDVTQETFLRALQGLHTFQLDASIGVRPWLFRILHNVVVRRANKGNRDADREREVGRAEAQSDADFDVSAGDDTRIDWDGVDQHLKAAIDELPLPLRTTFLLQAVAELSYKEIAAATEVPIGTVMSRLSRARRQLLSRLSSTRTHSDTRSRHQ